MPQTPDIQLYDFDRQLSPSGRARITNYRPENGFFNRRLIQKQQEQLQIQAAQQARQQSEVSPAPASEQRSKTQSNDKVTAAASPNIPAAFQPPTLPGSGAVPQASLGMMPKRAINSANSYASNALGQYAHSMDLQLDQERRSREPGFWNDFIQPTIDSGRYAIHKQLRDPDGARSRLGLAWSGAMGAMTGRASDPLQKSYDAVADPLTSAYDVTSTGAKFVPGATGRALGGVSLATDAVMSLNEPENANKTWTQWAYDAGTDAAVDGAAMLVPAQYRAADFATGVATGGPTLGDKARGVAQSAANLARPGGARPKPPANSALPAGVPAQPSQATSQTSSTPKAPATPVTPAKPAAQYTGPVDSNNWSQIAYSQDFLPYLDGSLMKSSVAPLGNLGKMASSHLAWVEEMEKEAAPGLGQRIARMFMGRSGSRGLPQAITPPATTTAPARRQRGRPVRPTRPQSGNPAATNNSTPPPRPEAKPFNPVMGVDPHMVNPTGRPRPQQQPPAVPSGPAARRATATPGDEPLLPRMQGGRLLRGLGRPALTFGGNIGAAVGLNTLWNAMASSNENSGTMVPGPWGGKMVPMDYYQKTHGTMWDPRNWLPGPQQPSRYEQTLADIERLKAEGVIGTVSNNNPTNNQGSSGGNSGGYTPYSLYRTNSWPNMDFHLNPVEAKQIRPQETAPVAEGVDL